MLGAATFQKLSDTVFAIETVKKRQRTETVDSEGVERLWANRPAQHGDGRRHGRPAAGRDVDQKVLVARRHVRLVPLPIENGAITGTAAVTRFELTPIFTRRPLVFDRSGVEQLFAIASPL